VASKNPQCGGDSLPVGNGGASSSRWSGMLSKGSKRYVVMRGEVGEVELRANGGWRYRRC
jgi:hypothetical protein